ncbi:MAG: hypothetical protein ACR2P0_01915, partial [Acidimicrobiales bacterium]
MYRIRRVVSALALISLVGTISPAPVGAQEGPPGQDNDTIVVTGHGWGHGRGMGQYGSFGYASEQEWGSAEILDHFYGDTVAGELTNELLTVRIDSANGLPTTVAVDSGALVLFDDTGDPTHIGYGGAMRLTTTASGFVIADAPTCAGPFRDRPGTFDVETIRVSSAAIEWAEEAAVPGGGSVVAGDWDGDGDDDIGLVSGDVWKLWYVDPANPDVPPNHSFT